MSLITLVQSNSNNALGATTCTTTLSQSTTAKNLVAIVITTSAHSVSTVAFIGNSDTAIQAPNTHGVRPAAVIYIYYVLSGSGGATSVTVTTTGGNDMRVTVLEYLGSAWKYDNSASNVGAGNVSVGVATKGFPGLIVAGCRVTGTGLTNGGITGGVGGTSVNRFANSTDLVDDRFVVTSPATYTFSETDGGSADASCAIAGFISQSVDTIFFGTEC